MHLTIQVLQFGQICNITIIAENESKNKLCYSYNYTIIVILLGITGYYYYYCYFHISAWVLEEVVLRTYIIFQ